MAHEENSKTFVVHIATIKVEISIYLSKTVQIATSQ